MLDMALALSELPFGEGHRPRLSPLLWSALYWGEAQEDLGFPGAP